MDEISTATQHVIDSNLESLIRGSIDAAETVQLCATHMKGIVDDILTISKIDSNLLTITPSPIRPVKTLQQALKMFVGECGANNIELNTHIEPSIEALKVDVVMLDPSRLLQVLINLLTNSIKFTKAERERRIDVYVGASLVPPKTEEVPHFHYFPTKRGVVDVTASKEFGTGELIYLRFRVSDTGCGLDESEQKNLFTRFSQASPRTHVQYGGSGLGLFISRQLTELQGGEIGVASTAGVGSTFAFYLKGRREVSGAAGQVVDLSGMPQSPLVSLEVKSSPQQKSYAGSSISSPPLKASGMFIGWHVLIVSPYLQ